MCLWRQQIFQFGICFGIAIFMVVGVLTLSVPGYIAICKGSVMEQVNHCIQNHY